MSSKKQMVINYVPGEECRVAIVEGGRLEEFHAERMDGPSNHVGNIYVGKVMNVELGIQAAFIDFGLEQNGFLHVSDVHPQYFPGEDSDKTERVGRKTPRRERPPIQDCFRRGDEVAVQVLKEGVGTKGPTVTSYLSIPGRFLVMMPQMDKVGVSRKVEDEETRRKMREILDQLDLPDGFGFILRTAGMERSKAELKRDLAYLMRLWKDMEARWKGGSKPRLLYSESDLLVRALRDLLTTDIEEVVVDNASALSRAARFLKIVAPRTSTRVVHYTGKAPIFHVMGIEPQIQMIHAREVPLESGGRLVIDEAEALVAIDVNSGKSREARDSETNAYQTNCEAVDEICRQLRLRDLGGVIVNDLIDMRSAKHRRDIETRVRDLLKKDRARWTIAPISEFGILEMTRQRMRASHESQHFTDCPTCRGRGLVQRPDSVVGDALRELAAILDEPGVARVELVVNPRIAGELLSSKRRALSRIEHLAGKHVDVRVSEAISVDRVTFYAYDERGADLDVTKLGHRRATEAELVAYEIASDASEAWVDEPEAAPPVDVAEFAEEPVEDIEAHPIELEPLSLTEISAQERSGQRQPQHHGEQQQGAGEEGGRGRRRRRGRRGRGGSGQEGFAQPGELRPGDLRPDGTRVPYPPVQPEVAYTEGDQPPYAPEPGYDSGAAPYQEGAPYQDDQGAGLQPGHAMNGVPPPPQGGEFGPGEQGQGGRKRRRRRGRRGRGGAGGPGGPGGAPGAVGDPGYMSQPDAGFAPGEDGYVAPVEGSEHGGYENQQPYAGEDGVIPPEGAMGENGESEVGAIGDGFGVSGDLPPQGGQPGFDDDQGGPRRRRRRRGRRGGGGGGGSGGAGGGQGQGPAVGPGPVGAPIVTSRGPRADAGAPSLAAMFRTAPVNTHAGDAADFAPAQATDGEGGYESGESDGGTPPTSDDGFAGDQQGTEAGGKRRRRRRGRGGGSNGGERGGPQDSGPATREPRQQFAPPPPQPKPTPAPAAGPQPKIRTLYVSRKRIAPGAVKGIKRED